METIKHQSAPRPQRPRPRRSAGPWIAGLSIGALFCLLVAIVLAYFLLTPTTAEAIGPSVIIHAPNPDQTIPLNELMKVYATAEHDEGITRLEIYSDGGLIAAQGASLAEGQTPLVAFLPWVPLTPGQHLLMARAYPVGGGVIDSMLVRVTVADYGTRYTKVNTGDKESTMREIASVFGANVEDIVKNNPNLNPDPDAPIPPGVDVVVPLPPAEPPPDPPDPPAPLPGAPAPPTNLAVIADCENAALSWTDAADETAYIVYRLDPPNLVPIATLPANTINYTDPLPALGTYTYQVASEKDGIQTLAPMASASTPGGCPPVLPPPAAILDLNLVMELLVTDAVWDGVYCYFDFNGTGYQRVPPADFLYMTPQPDGKTYDLSTQLPDSGQFHITGDTTVGISIAGECWGKLGPEVSLLGSFSDTHGPDEWDGSTLTQEVPGALDLTYHIDQVPPDGPPPWWDLGWIDVILGILALPAPHNLNVANSTAGCAEFSGLEAFFCAISGGGPSLTWDWTPNAFHTEAQLTRYHVTLRAHDLGTGTDTTIWTKNIYRAAPGEEIRRAQFVPTDGLPCGSQIIATVQAFEGLQASTVSDVVWQTTPACADMEITVTFDSFALDPAGLTDANEPFCFLCDPARLEIEGSLGVNGLWMVTDTTGGDLFNPCPFLAWCLGPGTHAFAGLNTWSIGGGTPSMTFNQPYTDAVTVWFGFDEVDEGSGTLDGCGGAQVFPPANPADWPTVINGTHTITAPMTQASEGSCALTFTIEGHAVP